MRTAVSALAVIALSAPALAQQATVSDRECRQLVEHSGSANATYQPGVDARGRPVAPADLPSSGAQIRAPQNFTIDLKTSLAGRYGIPSNSPLLDPSVEVGKITVEDGGRRVLYNGQPLGGSEQSALADLCKQRQQVQQPQGQGRPMTGTINLR